MCFFFLLCFFFLDFFSFLGELSGVGVGAWALGLATGEALVLMAWVAGADVGADVGAVVRAVMGAAVGMASAGLWATMGMLGVV